MLELSLAIDGPAASGKSVVGRGLAEHLGIGFVDTGLIYRACTLAVIQNGVNPLDEKKDLSSITKSKEYFNLIIEKYPNKPYHQYRIL